MPRGKVTTTRTRRSTRARSDASSVVGQITQLVATSETLKRENAELVAENQRLRGELTEIGSALGGLSGGRGRRGRGRGAVQPFTLAAAKPKRTRRPITDPE